MSRNVPLFDDRTECAYPGQLPYLTRPRFERACFSAIGVRCVGSYADDASFAAGATAHDDRLRMVKADWLDHGYLLLRVFPLALRGGARIGRGSNGLATECGSLGEVPVTFETHLDETFVVKHPSARTSLPGTPHSILGPSDKRCCATAPTRSMPAQPYAARRSRNRRGPARDAYAVRVAGRRVCQLRRAGEPFGAAGRQPVWRDQRVPSRVYAYCTSRGIARGWRPADARVICWSVSAGDLGADCVAVRVHKRAQYVGRLASRLGA